MTTIIQEAWTNDIFGYFQRLIQLKPHFVVFPLEDNTFNRCKSNIAAIEATVAGAVCISPDYMPEFGEIPRIAYHPNGEENSLFSTLEWINNNDVSDIWQRVHEGETPLQILRLSEINKIRIRIAAEITGKIATA